MAIINKRTSGFDRFVAQFAAQKKKSFAAVALVGLMTFMWIKVLTNKGPRSASAAEMKQLEMQQVEAKDPGINLTYVELPEVEGRHDRLVRDFFRMKGKSWGVKEEVALVTENGNRGKVIELAEKLSLVAISMGSVPEAFINDKLLKAGERLIIEDGSKSLMYEILKIEETVVFVKCMDVEFELKLEQQD